MSHPIAYAAMWLALATLMCVVNLFIRRPGVLKAGSFWTMMGFVVMAVLTLLGIVAVPS